MRTTSSRVRERKIRCASLLEKHAEANILDLLGMFPTVSRWEVSRSLRRTDVVEVRYIIIAFLYHVCLMGESQDAVAQYLEKPPNTVSKAIAAVDRAVRERKRTELKVRIEHVCGNLGLDVDWFTVRK